MKYLFILLAFPFLSASECGKKKKATADTIETTEKATDSIPPCVRKMIDDAMKEIPSNAPQRVDEYLYNGKKVYGFTARCCDQYNVVYDENCQMICAPSGGFSGKGDGKCPDFSKNAKHIKEIWKDPAIK